MNVNLVIEGANGSGKSTLIKQITDKLTQLGYEYKLHDLTKPKSDSEIDEMAEEFMHNSGINIYDRVYWFSDFIYPEIYGTPENEHVRSNLMEYWGLKQKVIHCVGQFEIDDDPSHKRTEYELEQIRSNREKLINKYENTMYCYQLNCSHGSYLRYENIEIDEVIQYILREV